MNLSTRWLGARTSRVPDRLVAVIGCGRTAALGFVLALLLLVGALPAAAVELRGRIDGHHPFTGVILPRPGAEVVLVREGGGVVQTVSGGDGFYYLHNAVPGPHELIVNGIVRVPIMVLNQPAQDIPPILLP